MSFITLIFVVICEVWWEAFAQATSYTVNLIAVAVVAVGCTGITKFAHVERRAMSYIQVVSTCLLLCDDFF